MTLRDYQVRAIEEARQRIASGFRAPVLVAPTGAGKTRIASEITRCHVALGGRVLWLAHRIELVRQASESLILNCGLQSGCVYPDAVPFPEEPVQVASVATLRARGMAPPASLLIVDECHHYSSDDWGLILDAYPDAIRVGLTATPCRADGRGLFPQFDCMVVVSTIRELTEQGHLVPCTVIAPSVPLKARELAMRPVDAYYKHCSPGASVVVFAESVSDAFQFQREFLDKGVSASVVHGKQSAVDRAGAIARHADGDVLINCMVLTEGWDSPRTSACILARGCGHVGTYLQIVGRVLRPHPEKIRARLIDLTGRAVHAHGDPAEDRVFALKGKAIRQKDGVEFRFCELCGSVTEDYPCESCGHDTGERHPPLRVKGTSLVKYETKRRETDEERARTLLRYKREGKKNKYRPGWAVMKYRAVYGGPPSWNVINLSKAPPKPPS